MRLSQVARKLHVGTDTLITYLAKHGFIVDSNPNSKITVEQFDLLSLEFGRPDSNPLSTDDYHDKPVESSPGDGLSSHGPLQDHQVSSDGSAKRITGRSVVKKSVKRVARYESAIPPLSGLKIVDKIEIPTPGCRNKPVHGGTGEGIGTKSVPLEEGKSLNPVQDDKTAPMDGAEKRILGKSAINMSSNSAKISIDTGYNIQEPTIMGKIVLPNAYHDKSDGFACALKTGKPYSKQANKVQNQASKSAKEDGAGISSQEISNQIKKTLAKLNQNVGKHSVRSRSKRERYDSDGLDSNHELDVERANVKKIRVTEFIPANELASLMGVTISDVISKCLALGMIISINQRLDKETITIVADEFGYGEVEFEDVVEEVFQRLHDASGEELESRAPIVTIMGHVDHGKTSLLDYIRSTKVIAKEAGGITQHIGAYDVFTKDGKKIVFLDTPGHEAFTAMRTRGAKLTDIIIIVVAADDSVMPQTREAISHAQIAGCPIIIAINKIDKPQANPERVKQDLANDNILVEDWGGKYQCQEISAKTGQGVSDLLEKIVLEAEMLELKARVKGLAQGTVLESFLDPGRGYIAVLMVQDGTLRVGDIVLAGMYYGKVRAILTSQGQSSQCVEPVTPVQILGLNGAPRAGDLFGVMTNIKEAADLAHKRQQIWREQSLRTRSHITLDEIGRRLSIGNFKKLDLIIKGDVDGSIEALADALLKLSHEEVEISILHKCVGPVSESDVMLAATTGAVIIAFHIKLSAQVKQLAESKRVEIKQYAIIYDAIDDVKNLVEKLLTANIEEVITGRARVKKIFTISKIGNIAGCQVESGFIKASNPVRVIRKDQVIFTGSIQTLKHGLDEIKQAKAMSECGVHIKDFNQIEIDDIIEGFEQREVQRKL